ncbi:MAG: hypothetical protein DMG79_03080 [Acidobacteria bacterium]|nr:MAG: hypothetical protein DMG79_03080 [Acidobacteriota bacterium]
MNVSKDLTMGGNGCWCTPDNFITKAWAEARPRAEPGAWRRVTLRASASVIGPALLLMLSTFLKAQETSSPATNTQGPEPSKKEERSTGLPKQAKWTFNFDAAWGTFGFGNSLYTDVRPDPSGNLSENWFEGFIKPALSASLPLGTSELYGKLSGVGERTYGAPPTLVGESASSFKQEDIYLGWRSGSSLGTSENLLDFTVGRAPYTIGHGFLVWDGTGEGGSRGGFWSNARKAWKFASIGRLKPKNQTIEAFYLERDDVPESQTGTRLTGVNYEYAATETSTFGASYIKAFARPNVLPNRDGMNAFNLRAYTAPIPKLSDLSFELEYAHEENHKHMHSTAWTALGAYQLNKLPWEPTLSYRYAFFEGDNPSTPQNEAFDPLFLGFYDWGTWWQGEIAGEYFLANSNSISHQARIHMSPTDKLGWGIMGYWFHIDQPGTFGPGTTSSDAAFEFDSYADWKFYKNFTLSLIAAFADPHKAVQQSYNRTSHFSYGMVYIAYSF